MAPSPTWEPHTVHGELDSGERNELPDKVFALPQQRKLPLTDASHVRNALARFAQVEGIDDRDRELAWANIKKAAKHYDVEIAEESWRDLGREPHTENPAQD